MLIGRPAAWELRDRRPVIWAFAKGSPRVSSQLGRSPVQGQCGPSAAGRGGLESQPAAPRRPLVAPSPPPPPRDNCARRIAWVDRSWGLQSKIPKCRRLCGKHLAASCPAGTHHTASGPHRTSPLLGPQSLTCHIPPGWTMRHCPPSWHHPLCPGSVLIHPGQVVPMGESTLGQLQSCCCQGWPGP